MSLSPEQYWAVRSMAADRAAAELARALRDRAVDWILLKGPAVASLLYTDGTSRRYVDVDALVAPADYETAEQALATLGYAPAPYSSRQHLEHDAPWRRPDGSIVDLHRTFTRLEAEPQHVWHVIRKDARHVSVAGEQIRIPAPGPLALLIALHALGDAPLRGKARADLERAVERLPEGTWAAARADAERLGATRDLAAALSLIPQGEAVARAVGLPRISPREASLRSGRTGELGALLARIGSARGLQAKAAAVAELFRAGPRADPHDPAPRGGRALRAGKAVSSLPGAAAAWWVRRRG